MKVKLTRDIDVPNGSSYRAGQHVFVSWTDNGDIILGGKNGIYLDYGIDFVPIWDVHFLRDKMKIKYPTVKEKS